MQDTVILIVKTIITALLLLTMVLLLSSIIRRAYKARKYRQLDYLRWIFDKRIHESLESGTLLETQGDFIARPKSNAWQAIEDILLRLINGERYRDEAQKMCSLLGYVSFYEKQLENRDVQVRALSADKLGRMKSEASVPKLIALLDDKNPEIVSIAVRSLSKIGGRAALHAIVRRLPVILDQSIVTRKAMGMALQSFGTDAIPYLVEHPAGGEDLWVISCILDILSRLPADPRSARLAAGHLSSAHAEVRSKALRVLGRVENIHAVPNLPELVLPLLRDPVWFVRLQAIRSVRALGHEAAPLIGKLIVDDSWQVRNEAVRALTALGDRSLDIFLGVLTGADRYAKDSVCEELEITNFTDRLIKNLNASDRGVQKKSHRVLEIMHSLGFSTPLHEYLERAGGGAEKEIIRSMMRTGPGA